MGKRPSFAFPRFVKFGDVEMLDEAATLDLCNNLTRSAYVLVCASSDWCTDASGEQKAELLDALDKFACHQLGSVLSSISTHLDACSLREHPVGGAGHG